MPTNPRQRRSRDEVAARIQLAAREVFAESGYAGATTKEIARRADASETLVFRYFSSKAALFDETVSTPFNELMSAFLSTDAGRIDGLSRASGSQEFVSALFPLLDANRALLSALVTAPVQRGERPILHGLDNYFTQSINQLEQHYKAEGGKADLDLQVAVRVGFGMVVATVLLRDWLFAEGTTQASAISDVLHKMLFRALTPVKPIEPG